MEKQIVLLRAKEQICVVEKTRDMSSKGIAFLLKKLVYLPVLNLIFADVSVEHQCIIAL